MFEGKLVGIYTASGEGAPMVATDSIQAVKGAGLAGDRYANGIGHFSARGGPGREVTLIEREAIAAVNAEQGLDVGEHETRRNLVTEGVPLNHLVGRTFRVGAVVFYGCPRSPPVRVPRRADPEARARARAREPRRPARRHPGRRSAAGR